MSDSNTQLTKRDEVVTVDTSLWLDVPIAPQGAAPSLTPSERLLALNLSRDGKLVVGPDTIPAAVEQYRRLAAVMYHAQANRGIRTAMVASAFAAEGKSLTAANLALTLSESYRTRVLLIDADLRRPSLHDTFQIPNLAGVSDWLTGDGAGKMPLVEITPNLTLLPGGRPNYDPMSALTSQRMKQVLKLASERFDWVILDTPPVGFLPDGHVLAAMVDTVVFVVAAGRTPAPVVQRAVEELGRDRIIGVVLNRIEQTEMHAYGDSSYYGRYRYSDTSVSKGLRG
jgi:protein-tyrosine kinase